jgi:hypothetical protein
MEPNDEHEQDRMDLAHHIYLMLTGGKLFLAPIHNPQYVLDLGTGTGMPLSGGWTSCAMGGALIHSGLLQVSGPSTLQSKRVSMKRYGRVGAVKN